MSEMVGAAVWRRSNGAQWEPVTVYTSRDSQRFWFETRDGHSYGFRKGYGTAEVADLRRMGKLSDDPELVQEFTSTPAAALPGEPMATPAMHTVGEPFARPPIIGVIVMIAASIVFLPHRILIAISPGLMGLAVGLSFILGLVSLFTFQWQGLIAAMYIWLGAKYWQMAFEARGIHY